MSFRTVYGYSFSENGWRMVNRDGCTLVPGPYMNTAPLRFGAPATILGDFVRRYHNQCAPVISPVWGWSATNDVANSNHLSGTAIDINAPQWPWGYKRMPADLINRINTLLAFYEGAVFWGRNWTKPDEMHFQMGWREGDPRLDRIVAKINGGSTPVTGTGNYAQPGDKGDKVRKLQAFLNQGGYAVLVVDGDYGPATTAAVAEFQRRAGVTPQLGVVGPTTLAALRKHGFNPDNQEAPVELTDRQLLEQIAADVTEIRAQLSPDGHPSWSPNGPDGKPMSVRDSIKAWGSAIRDAVSR